MDNYFGNLFYRAAEAGDLRRLRSYRGRRTRLQIRYSVWRRVNGMTPLAIACRNGHVAVVEYLIEECGADVEKCGWINADPEFHQRRAQPLWWAAHSNRLDVVQCLLEHGANVNCVTPTLVTPLIEACTRGHLEIVRWLVASGADINAVQHDGQNALMVACRQNQREIADLLIVAGAVLNGRDVNGETALHHCVHHRAWTFVKLLLRRRAPVDEILCLRTPVLIIKRSNRRAKLEYVICLPFHPGPWVIESLERMGANLMDLSRQRHYKLHTNKTEDEEREEAEGRPIDHPRLDPRERRVDYITISRQATDDAIRPGFSHCYHAIRPTEEIINDDEETDMSKWTMAMLMRRVSREPVRNMIWRCLTLFVRVVEGMTVRQLRSHCVVVLAAFIIAVHETESEARSDGPSPRQVRSDRIVYVVLNLLMLALEASSKLSEGHQWLLLGAIRRCVRVNLCSNNGATLLHYACRGRQTSHNSRLTLDFIARVVRVLLRAGAETLDIDDNYRNPLHHLLIPPHRSLTLVEAGEVPDAEEVGRRIEAEARRVPAINYLTRRLLELGTHFDGRNCEGQHFLDALPVVERWHQYDAARYVSLRCLAANAILQHRIPYRPRVPDILVNFIMEHRTRQQISEGL